MNVVLDTNALIHVLTNSATGQAIAKLLGEGGAFVMISIVTKAELVSIATQRNWGSRKQKELDKLLDELLTIPIDNEELVSAYAEIDAFSQGKLPGRKLGTSARNMGKNDLWIAATAYLAKAKLLTWDHDFQHLHGHYIQVEHIRTAT